MTKYDTCEYCDGQMESRIIQARFLFKGQTVYINGVPAWVCNKCSEPYYDAPVYKRMEEIAKQHNLIKKTICFPLAEYDKVLV